MINNIHIVLVGTTHPGNIGAAARAMKNMSQKSLRLVNPKIYPSAEATARATGADDVLINAVVFDDLKEAISDFDFVIGTSARTRSIPWPMMTPRECAEHIEKKSYKSVAIIFGRESSGLSNEELELCNRVLQIPTNPEYSSLNIAAAVQIVCYELFLLSNINDNNDQTVDEYKIVNHEKMEQLYQHMEECMLDVDFLDKTNPGKLMHRIRRLFNRSQVEENEWKILRGFLSNIQAKIK